MLLTIDIGNTQTAIGLFDDEELVGHWALTTRSGDTVDEIHHNLMGQLQLKGFSFDNVHDVVIASVVPALTMSWATVAKRITGNEPIIVGPGVRTGLPMHYDNPAEIGADRVADAVAAINLVGAPAIVVDLGTATNIEVIDKDGCFLGGIIAPGMGTGASALSTKTARLPQVDLVMPEHNIGTNTTDAIRLGLLLGEIARVDGLVKFIFEELGYEAPVIATGGFSNLIASELKTVTHREPRLTLNGLRLIYEYNKGRGKNK